MSLGSLFLFASRRKKLSQVGPIYGKVDPMISFHTFD
jgi:hypothetical protein